MNHIEEMMKTAGVRPKYYYDITLQDTIKPEEKFPLRSCSKKEVISYCRDKDNYGYCKVNKTLKIFPKFTAEKQLEIIKLITELTEIHIYTIPYANEGNKYFVGVTDGNAHLTRLNQDFAQALAQLTTELMKAGELDKEKVKEILEN